MKKLAGGATILAAAIVVFVITAVAVATTGTGVTNTSIATGTLPPIDVKVKTGDWKLDLKTKGDSELGVSQLTINAGGSTGWHSHPGPSLVVVKSGTLTFYRGDDPSCTPQVHEAGSAFVDPGGVVHMGRNEGTEPVVLITTRLIPSGVPSKFDEGAPGNCNF